MGLVQKCWAEMTTCLNDTKTDTMQTGFPLRSPGGDCCCGVSLTVDSRRSTDLNGVTTNPLRGETTRVDTLSPALDCADPSISNCQRMIAQHSY